ncbi:hypothetical protein GIS00_23820 [Nakamurella sp. YIM 132087]|uniref:Uncharacterized protein n=1 Tax=Nakamurella alba TaxID=2665158 RepID=A0A7K1FS55_9ACTN|nr:hypothetical protein [Nakamurella alba]MTD16968.1 hypothetical protein [Nakamurella alba]
MSVGPNPDPSSGLPGVGYTAHDPLTGQPISTPEVYPQQSSTGQPVYQAPPPPPGYAQPGYAQPGYPQPYPPGYPPQAGYGYPPYAMPVYYPVVPPRPARPGAATASAVLQFVQSGFVLIGAIYTLGGSMIFDLVDSSSFYYSGGSSGWESTYGTQFTVVAVATFLVGGLLIAGGATLLGRRSLLTVIACLGSLAISVYWIIFVTNLVSVLQALLWLPIMLAVMPIISLALVMGGSVRTWIAARPG